MDLEGLPIATSSVVQPVLHQNRDRSLRSAGSDGGVWSVRPDIGRRERRERTRLGGPPSHVDERSISGIATRTEPFGHRAMGRYERGSWPYY